MTVAGAVNFSSGITGLNTYFLVQNYAMENTYDGIVFVLGQSMILIRRILLHVTLNRNFQIKI